MFQLALQKLINHHASLPAGAPEPPPHKLASLFADVVPSDTPLAVVREAFEKDFSTQVKDDGGTDAQVKARM